MFCYRIDVFHCGIASNQFTIIREPNPNAVQEACRRKRTKVQLPDPSNLVCLQLLRNMSFIRTT